MKHIAKVTLIAVFLIGFLFAGMQVGNSMNSTSDWPEYGEICENKTCVSLTNCWKCHYNINESDCISYPCNNPGEGD